MVVRIKCQAVVVRMERSPDVGDGPRVGHRVPGRFPEGRRTEVDDVGSGRIGVYREVVEALGPDVSVWQRDGSPCVSTVRRSIEARDLEIAVVRDERVE